MFKFSQFFLCFSVLAVVSSQVSIAQALVYADAKSIDKTEAVVGEEVSILGENFSQTGTKKCMKLDGSREQFECAFRAQVTIVKQGPGAKNINAPITSLTSTKVTFKVPNVPSGLYSVYYEHFAAEHSQFSIIGDYKLKITNNTPVAAPVSPKPTSSPVVSPSPSPSPLPSPIPSPVVSPVPATNTEATTPEPSWIKQASSGFVNWVKSWFSD